ncbi:GDYXXLXY domain-containing protein [Chengkuizengella sediminis]|uniref:GDYXXLXY domain-containing protein n=1 Tax=Chengkuizengella sediminis TaxID=1885917 RepID=UPI00138A5BD6|nr:GDYXXLXY domain-containing protein [Chengkuizengella sediminis]NDI33948.1 GDYXXLXY domain-containing protein [Chengkuizengella sediminis]
MRSSKRGWFIVVLLFQVCFLISISLSNYSVEWFGKELRLKTVPVDPRDLFYGDYVVLNYEINDIPKTLWQEVKSPVKGEKITVRLIEEKGYYTIESIGQGKPEGAVEDHIYLEAVVSHIRGDSIFVEYGIEKYYVPEGEGKELEEQRGEFDVIVKKASWGNLKISRIEFIES